MRARYGDALLGHVGASNASAERVVPTFVNREPWTRDALCRQVDPELFFPDPGSTVLSSGKAKALCNSPCPVKDECLEYAFRNDERWGVWGGLSARERQDLRRKGNA